MKSAMEIAAKDLEKLIGSAKSPMSAIDELKEEVAKRGNRYLANILYKMFMGESVKIVCYGDSITYGFQSGTGNQVENPYPSVLQSRLRQIYNNDNITTINEGHSGWRTDQALSNIYSVLNQEPDLVLVMFGINDCNNNNIPLIQYRDNLIAIIDSIRSAGSDVLLLTPTPTRKIDVAANKRLRQYADIVREVASNNGVCYVDLHNEIERLWQTADMYPVDTLGDRVHFSDDQYKLVADLILYGVLQFNAPNKLLYVDSRNEFSIQTVYSPFIDTNLTNVFSNDDQIYKQNYVMGDVSGLYLRLDFFCAVSGMSLLIRHARNRGGGVIVVSDNGVDVAEVDFYTNVGHRFNTETVLIDNLALGWHSILFDQSRITAGNENGLNAYIGEILFRPIPSNREDRVFVNATGSSLPLVEKFTPISGRIRITNNDGSQTKGVTLFSAGSVALDSSKKLAIEAEGIFSPMSGLTWFGDDYQNGAGTVVSGVNSGYVAYITNNAISLHYAGLNNAVSQLTIENHTLDLSSTHLVRIEHSFDGTISIYVDGVKYIDFIDDTFNSGYFGLWMFGIGTTDLDRFEYCYV